MRPYIDMGHLSTNPLSKAIVPIASKTPSCFPNDAPYYWMYFEDHRFFSTPYTLADGTRAYPGVPESFPKSVSPPSGKKVKWRILWYQLLVLDWLKDRGEAGCHTAAVTACIGLLLISCHLSIAAIAQVVKG
jgi:hypothetical protein